MGTLDSFVLQMASFGGLRRGKTETQAKTHASTSSRKWTPSKAYRRIASVVIVACLLCLAVAGCYGLDSARMAVDRVDFFENEMVDDGEIADKIATAPSPRFLGIWDGVAFEYEYFDRYVLQQDLTRIERFYKSKGFYSARVTAARVVPAGKTGHVRVEIVVSEGPPTVVQSVALTGMDSVPEALRKEVHKALEEVVSEGPRKGRRFDETEYEGTKDRIRATLLNRGFAWSDVTGTVNVDLYEQKADVVYEVRSGPHFLVRSVTFLGLENLPEKQIRRVFNVSKGNRFSAMDLESGKGGLLDLGVLADVQVTWQQGKPTETVNIPRNERGEPAVDVWVRCTKAPLRTIKLGGGMEFDTLRTEGHGVAGWEHRNFIGGLRRFSLTLKPGWVLYPTRIGDFTFPPDEYLFEGKLLASLRQPGFLDHKTTGIVRANASRYPVDLAAESKKVILGYHELTGSVGLERPFFRNFLFGGTSFHLQYYHPFDYLSDGKPEGLGAVLIPYIELIGHIDFRDNQLRPHKGVFLSNSFQFAGGFLGGDASDTKVQPELRVYVPVSKSMTLAIRSTVGFIFPRNYSSLDFPQIDESSPRTRERENELERSKDNYTRNQQLMYLRGFFSGGPSSNRGYPYRSVGPHGKAGFLAPNMSASELSTKCSADYSQDACSVPLGGLSVWEASTELRYPIIGALTGAFFADASDVSRKQAAFRSNYIHLSVGAGLRYDTPVGPIRLDAGYRVPGLQKLGCTDECEPYEPSRDVIFSQPLAYSFGIGQAF